MVPSSRDRQAFCCPEVSSDIEHARVQYAMLTRASAGGIRGSVNEEEIVACRADGNGE